MTNKNGVMLKIAGIKTLVKHLMPVRDLHKISYVGVHDPEGNTTVEMPYTYFVKLLQAYQDGNTRLEGMAGLCTYGDIPVRFLRPGACGALITAKVGSAEKIIGQFTGVKPMHCAYVFPAVTVEEWNHVVARTDESINAAVPAIKATCMVPSTARKGVTVHTPLKFVDKVMRPKNAEHFFEGGLSTIASLPATHLPIDQKCKKKPVMGFMFGEMYDVLKYPIMNKADIERKCAHVWRDV